MNDKTLDERCDDYYRNLNTLLKSWRLHAPDREYLLIRDLQARIKELEARQQWQPIETAPKDGTPILVRYEKDNVLDILPARNNGMYVATWRANSDPLGYYAWRTIDVTFASPTHWMPLPEPPHE